MFLLSEMSEMFPKFYLRNVELKVVGQESTNNEYRFCWDRSIEFVKPSLNFRSRLGELMTALLPNVRNDLGVDGLRCLFGSLACLLACRELFRGPS